MDHCEWMNVKTVKICAPVLKSCIIHDSLPDGRENNDCDVKVDAQSLVMKEECWEDEDFKDDMVPGCLLTHLKALKIGILSENKNPKSKYKNSRQVDLSFLKYFLKNA
ncbi:hypothetical protein GIB67_029614 [Kingdonia uniflora]|uniref:FBD domain-containing protein n=1 Tax=Kingdonia uniflora TaxID=39325 RepID=A0A7J7LL93_9MAGN|nr:hypothetical protein GIB67_029614 [Kingdonia uniflora]